MPIPPPFISHLREHKAQQEQVSIAAGDRWQEDKLVFTRPDGSRHTVGTILNEFGVDMPTIMEILRHTQISQTRRYVRGRSHLSKGAVRRMGDHSCLVPNPQLRPRTPAPPAPGSDSECTERKSPAQTVSELGSKRAPCRIRTDDPSLTRGMLWPSELRRRCLQRGARRRHHCTQSPFPLAM